MDLGEKKTGVTSCYTLQVGPRIWKASLRELKCSKQKNDLC